MEFSSTESSPILEGSSTSANFRRSCSPISHHLDQLTDPVVRRWPLGLAWEALRRLNDEVAGAARSRTQEQRLRRRAS